MLRVPTSTSPHFPAAASARTRLRLSLCLGLSLSLVSVSVSLSLSLYLLLPTVDVKVGGIGQIRACPRPLPQYVALMSDLMVLDKASGRLVRKTNFGSDKDGEGGDGDGDGGGGGGSGSGRGGGGGGSGSGSGGDRSPSPVKAPKRKPRSAGALRMDTDAVPRFTRLMFCNAADEGVGAKRWRGPTFKEQQWLVPQRNKNEKTISSLAVQSIKGFSARVIHQHQRILYSGR